MIVFLVIMSLIGMELFAYKVFLDEDGNIDKENGESPRQNFDTFINAVIATFIILSGED